MSDILVRRDDDTIEIADLTSDEEKIVKAFKEHIALMLKDDWYITVKFAAVEEDYGMETEAKPEYRKAIITVDIAQIKDQWEYLNHFIRHELLHIIVWNFFDIAGTLAYKNTSKAMEKLEEQVIYLLEHMPLWDNLYKGDINK